MKPLIVVPFHDPKWLQGALENVRRQSLPSLFVLNGEAEGLVLDGVSTVTSGKSHAAAVNAGASWAAEHGYTHVVLFDSDDYYGRLYASKVTLALETADYCGQREVFVQLQDGSVHLMKRPGRCFVFGTVGFSVSKFVPVVDTLDNCLDWSTRMDAAGCSKADTGFMHYCYFRHGQNAHWDGRLPDLYVRKAWGPSLKYTNLDHTACEGMQPLSWEYCPAPSDAEAAQALATWLLEQPALADASFT